jgi:hypothetical protein
MFRFQIKIKLHELAFNKKSFGFKIINTMTNKLKYFQKFSLQK